MESRKKDQPVPIKEKSFFREIQIEFLIHELKDPIAIIETGARLLIEKKEKYGALTTRQGKTLNRVLRNAKKAQEMLHDLLEVGRSESGHFVCCRLQPTKLVFDVLMATLEIKAAGIFEQAKECGSEDKTIEFLNQNGIFLEIDPQLACTEINQDENKFCQIAANLIKNALHYKNERVTIKVKCVHDNLLFEVTDDGPGISSEHHEKIFQRYAQINSCPTLSRQSHGLGLAGALILARYMGGNIEIDSQEGKGATFRLILPCEMKT